MFDKFRSANIRNILERALWTFLEGFITGVSVDGLFGLTGGNAKSIIMAAIIGGIAAGISAVKTLVVDMINQKIEETGAEIETEEILPGEPEENLEGAYTDADE